MGMRFDFNSVNWLAYIIEPNGVMPAQIGNEEAKETLELFLDSLSERFLSDANRRERLVLLGRDAGVELLNVQMEGGRSSVEQAIKRIRLFFAARAWTALIIPSGGDPEIDAFLCSKDFLDKLVNIRPDDPGLILQLDIPPEREIVILDVFPAFKVALSESDKWPGILLWSKQGDSVFLPFESSLKAAIIDNSYWIFNYLASSVGLDLALLKSHYYKAFPALAQKHRSRINFLHISDLHIGSKEANLRLPRVRQLIEDIASSMGDITTLVPIITGDLLDSPDEHCLDGARQFLGYISSLFERDAIIVLGNHDVRKNGFLSEQLRQALQIKLRTIEWFEKERVGVVCFNSVIGGSLAQGQVGDRQYFDLGNEIDRRNGWEDYTLISVLHHHPLPVKAPSWYAKKFYERLFPRAFEKSLVLKDAKKFVDFTESRNVAMVLHGHKHIPRYAETKSKKIPVFGCGSTTGKVTTTDGSIYMSLNCYSIDTQSHRITARLLAERIPGGGLVESKSHEILYRS